MGMFLNYQTISDSYVPNNLMKAFPHKLNDTKLNPLDASKPYEEYDAKGNLCGYFWRYGETLNLEFQIDGEVTVENDSVVSSVVGVKPTVDTIGYIGQRFYNVADLASWTCSEIQNNQYTWEQDQEFTYPLESDRSVYISAVDYLKDKNVEIVIYDFRMEPVVQQVLPASPQVIFKIDKDLSARMKKGIYYCKVTVFNEEIRQVIFDTTDCQLLVK